MRIYIHVSWIQTKKKLALIKEACSGMEKIKSQIKNIRYTTGFLFRPITPVAFSFTFLLISSALLIFIIFNLDESTKAYQVLLAILTGITASLLIASCGFLTSFFCFFKLLFSPSARLLNLPPLFCS